MFKLDKFKVIPQSQLSKSCFEEFPVWSEHYDYEEIEDIERWGLNKEKVLKLFETNSQGNEHCVYTLLESDPFPERMRIFIKAKLNTANGVELDGYVVNENAYCLGVFYKGKEFIFSTHPLLIKENNKQQQDLALLLNSENADIFPIEYITTFKSRINSEIKGEFIYNKKDT